MNKKYIEYKNYKPTPEQEKLRKIIYKSHFKMGV
jgi:hypothetical protein